MPADLKLFERLAYLSVLVNTAMFIIENASPAGWHYGLWAMIAFVAATLTTAVVFISVMARFCINWLRWLYASTLAISAAGNIWLTPATFATGANRWMQVLTVACIVLNVACVYLLVSRPASEWFRGNTAASNGAAA